MISFATKIRKNIAVIGVCDKEIVCPIQEEPEERYESHTDYPIAKDWDFIFIIEILMQSHRFIC